MSDISIAGLGKQFGDSKAIDDVTIHIEAGSFVSILGPSGCGKTTLLRLIAGFETPDRGSIHFGPTLIADHRRQLPPEDRGVGVVFQSYALWPHMNVRENVAYPLRTRKVAAGETERRVQAVLETVGLAGFADRRIGQLSGGQQQRVALARCLVADCRVILFDEPLANLDMHLRASMAEIFREIHGKTGATMVYITHDQAEALALADLVVVMSRGRILQAAPPAEIYRTPADATVAGFVGRGSLMTGHLIGQEGDRAVVRAAGGSFEVRASSPMDGAADLDRPVEILLRPEALALSSMEDGLRAVVRDAIFRGSHYEVILVTEDGQRLVLDSPHSLAAGAAVTVSVRDGWLVPR